MPSWDPEVWIALVSAVVAVLALALMGASFKLAQKQVRAAERANQLTEQGLDLQRRAFERELRVAVAEPQQLPESRTGERSDDPMLRKLMASAEAMAAAWPGVLRAVSLPLKLERSGKNTFELRNVSTGVLENLTVDSDAVALSRNLPVHEKLAPGQAARFWLFDSFQAERPAQLWVTWDGQEQPVPLPVPH